MFNNDGHIQTPSVAAQTTHPTGGRLRGGVLGERAGVCRAGSSTGGRRRLRGGIPSGQTEAATKRCPWWADGGGCVAASPVGERQLLRGGVGSAWWHTSSAVRQRPRGGKATTRPHDSVPTT